MIINTGQRTDIPAFYAKWFANRLIEGFVCVRNPYNPNQVSKYRLDPSVVDVIGFGHTVAGVSQFIPNPTVAGIVFWVLQILISVIAIGIVFLTIYSLIITYVRYMKAKQFDRYTVIIAITVLAFTVFLAGVIKGIAPINLFALQISLFLIFSGIRAWVVRRRYKVS